MKPDLRLDQAPLTGINSRSRPWASRASPCRKYKRQYPEGEAAAASCGFTNVEDKGQEGMELAFNNQLAGEAWLAPRDQGPPGPRGRRRGRDHSTDRRKDMQLSIDSKVQFFAYQRCATRWPCTRPELSSVVVMDAHPGFILRQLPQLRARQAPEPDRRAAAQPRAHRRVQAGSTMKPFTIGLALESGRVKPETVIDTSPGASASLAPPFPTRTTTARSPLKA